MQVMIADDSILFREGVARILSDAGHDVTGSYGNADSLLSALEAESPEVVVLDVRMPPSFTDEGLRAAIEIRHRHPEVGVLVLSQHVETSYARDLLASESGRVGYLLKDRVLHLDDFFEAVRRVGSGGTVVDPTVVARLLKNQRDRSPLSALSARETEVLALMAEGRTNRAISDRLFVGEKTVESHVASIFTKLGLLPAADDHRRVLAVLTYLRPLGDT